MNEQEIEHVLRIGWGLAEPGARGPRAELSPAQIVDTAVTIADEQGISAVTMARVAERLGFSAMSLYRHLGSKEELLALMIDRAGRFPEMPESNGDWRSGLSDMARRAIVLYRQHPWLLDVPTSMVNILLPGGVRTTEAVLAILRDVPLAQDEKLAILLAFTVTLRAYAALARDITSQAKVFTPVVGEILGEVITADRFPNLAPMLDGGLYGEPESAEEMDEDLGYALERLFDGIAARIAQSDAR
ncbi:TetR family transcriptional regulator [Epidermidibacterium keratini]|uniref:TetR family transcriptional regulator n=1 Tax=Epidermidibacterium keratini TaxID=1891644 RepID=A0A7L4YPU0_9ACTN|nr:TetR/AcrR family transcriptional regulator [Epidermidibacterium keratini]QHC01078.1 TetR family transcriptional regulator [Epidermidibacterium keratini]